ncbi:probable disease resistance protein At5g66900 isoform X2 [Rosa chinensis]|uniref:probable disease resistance protein At5g66900 isoform X2 n=1 Tax=Rosa chinensis TaxID=74649 RepID=UPI001AD91F65|nr:probable disease resistance protein At5g66900 isoform X2 [Rosa chinensis]
MEAVTLIGGAALGTAFTALYEVVKESKEYKPMLKRLKGRLTFLDPMIAEVRRTNTMLQGVEDIMKEMDAGRQLIQECSRAHWLTGTYTRYGYASKLRSLNRALKDLMQILIAYGVLQLTENNNVLTRICQSPLPEPPQFTVGLDKPLGELKKLIGMDGESMVVITAPGGCGKTTLATKFCHDQEVKDKYKNIFFVTVSENPNWDRIVEQLFQRKGWDYKLLKNERNTDSWLEYFLRADQQPSLLVLDEVWLGWESRKLLDKFDRFKNSNCKILVTSRFHFPKFRSYYLKSLNDEDAKELFHHSALLGERTCAIPESLSKKVLEFCKGLPFAITVVGESLARQEREIWERVTKGSILKLEMVVHNRLESSLKALESENPLLKECFLDLALFFEDRLISAAALIDLWSELYDDLNEDSSCIANLTDLKNRTLANLVFPRSSILNRMVQYSTTKS